MQSTREVPLTRGLVAIVDAEDYSAVMSAGPWRACKTAEHVTYAARSVASDSGPRKTLTLHRFITGLPYVDHINGDGLDNRRSNLRPATRSQNMANRRMNENNKSGFKGVYWNKASGKWHTQIGFEGRKLHLGFHVSVVDAARAYDDAAVRLFGEYARVNFPTNTNTEHGV